MVNFFFFILLLLSREHLLLLVLYDSAVGQYDVKTDLLTSHQNTKKRMANFYINCLFFIDKISDFELMKHVKYIGCILQVYEA